MEIHPGKNPRRTRRQLNPLRYQIWMIGPIQKMEWIAMRMGQTKGVMMMEVEKKEKAKTRDKKRKRVKRTSRTRWMINLKIVMMEMVKTEK